MNNSQKRISEKINERHTTYGKTVLQVFILCSSYDLKHFALKIARIAELNNFLWDEVIQRQLAQVGTGFIVVIYSYYFMYTENHVRPRIFHGVSD